MQRRFNCVLALLAVVFPAACGGETGRDQAGVARGGSGASAPGDGGADAGGSEQGGGSGGSETGTGGTAGAAAGSGGASSGQGGSGTDAGGTGGSAGELTGGSGGEVTGGSGGEVTGGSAGQTSGGTGGSELVCPDPLPQETIDSLGLAPLLSGGIIQLSPGDSYAMTYLTYECCYYATPIETCTSWSVAPSMGATIDPLTGLFTVDATTPGGSVFTVTGNVENGRHVDSIDVHVVTSETQPLVGNWGEDVRYHCATGEELQPEGDRIGEVLFFANGQFSVTWIPFELRRDYWGSYSFDLDAGTVELVIDAGNYIPDDADLEGTFFVDAEGRLVLLDIWLGAAPSGTAEPACGHRLTGGFRSGGN